MKNLLYKLIDKSRKSNKGQGLVEYGFLLVLMALAVLVAVKTLGSAILDFLNNFSSQL
ncbi:MAG: Flp family type IVb pilin [Bacillota bacterium]|nr:Flp family type IVb pilin [Bacillota bacterium]